MSEKSDKKGDVSPKKENTEKKPNRGNIHTKFNFRTPQQYKKMWNKRHNKADVENLQNIKNQISHSHRQSQLLKSTKQIYNKKMIAHRNISGSGETSGGASAFAVRSKFFLPDKRPRKEIIIPPTKFLLGGNISDPLNLNSLQHEAMCGNTTPSSTPRQSPITTPPKVEIYMPPNIHDPLHLLDPVDSVEYEKQLVSPMKRKGKHRHRKKKPKRRRFDSLSTPTKGKTNFENLIPSEVEPSITMSTIVTDLINTAELSAWNCTTPSATVSIKPSEVNTEVSAAIGEESATTVQAIQIENSVNASERSCTKNATVILVSDSNVKDTEVCEQTNVSVGKIDMTLRRSDIRDKAAKELKLDLNKTEDPQQQITNSICGGRKRKISEGSTKNKFRRLDSMDKIVSPVVPQPGAWKRPPRNVPTGARKGSRNISASMSESDLISPLEEVKTGIFETICATLPEPSSSSITCANTVDVCHKVPAIPTTSADSGEKKACVAVTNIPKRPKFKPEDQKYQYGNYDRYSNYRNLNEFMDVRLQVFLRNSDLFKNKDVLDVGCNVGHMTIAVGKSLYPKSILGIDIDSKLIARARRNLSLFVRIPRELPTVDIKSENVGDPVKVKANITNEIGESSQKNTNPEKPNNKKKTRRRKKPYLQKPNDGQDRDKCNLFPVSFPICYGGIPSTETINDTSPSVASDGGRALPVNEFPKNVFFRQTNYVLKDETLLNNDLQQYDIIMCLSVTKWIHLNFGDTGLKMAFKRMFNQLRPGGKLILEAQNWASYKKKKNLTETIYNNYSSIEFFPNKFHEYLLSNEVGFSHSFTLGIPRHLSKGFCRPIQLYAKGDFTPSHVQWSDAYHPQTPYVAYRGIYASIPRQNYPLCWDTPRGGNNSNFQTPMYQPGSQYYNPLETDSYLPSYDTEILNRHYVFASPLYQTVWSPPASLRNSSSHTPVFGSVREAEMEGQQVPRHVYPPNEVSPSQVNSAFSVREESEQEESPKHQHVYAANCDSSSSPKTDVDA